jgi:hypothetical protein
VHPRCAHIISRRVKRLPSTHRIPRTASSTTACRRRALSSRRTARTCSGTSSGRQLRRSISLRSPGGHRRLSSGTASSTCDALRTFAHAPKLCREIRPRFSSRVSRKDCHLLTKRKSLSLWKWCACVVSLECLLKICVFGSLRETKNSSEKVRRRRTAQRELKHRPRSESSVMSC